jgi:hypothetical protein
MLDRIIALLKWPVGIASLVFLPGAFYALVLAARDAAARPAAIVPALLGAGAFVAFWLVLLAPDASRRRVITLEHELVHALAAALTLHRVSGLRAGIVGGGHVRYVGRGNWLVAISPFVLPLFALLVMAIGHWCNAPRVIAALVGAALAWNVIGNWAATHRHYGDHREAGPVFAFLVIACANALVVGLVLERVTHTHSLAEHLARARGPAAAFFAWLVHLVSPG